MTSRNRTFGVAAVLGPVAAGLLAAAGLWWWRTHDVGPVERGARLAAAHGCLSCHGALGAMVDPDDARGIGHVPSFDHDDVTEHARDEADLRSWILEGRPREAGDEAGEGPEPLLRMPAWKGVLSEREVDALVAYVKAVSAFDPLPADAAAGRDTAARLGCFACHGPGGRGDTPNPGSLKGHIPRWDGADFLELARDEGEIREWVKDGAPRRLREHPVAAFFLQRQTIRMPAFGEAVTDEEIRRIAVYIRWLRSQPRE